MSKGLERAEEDRTAQVATTPESKLVPFKVPGQIFDFLIERIPQAEIVDEIKECEIEVYSWLDPRTRRDFRHHIYCNRAVIFRAGSLGEVLVLNGNHRAIWGRDLDGTFSGGTNFDEERLYKHGGEQGDFVLYAFFPGNLPHRGRFRYDEFLNPRVQKIIDGIRRALHTDEALGNDGATQEGENLAFRIGRNSGYVASLSYSLSPREMLPPERFIELRTQIAVVLQLLG